MRSLVAVFALVVLPSTSHAAPAVEVYGAQWCGPCKVVQRFLRGQAVPFTYVDIDTEAGRRAYAAVSPDGGGIPLVVIAGERIRGANLSLIRSVLQRRGQLTKPAAPATSEGEQYGGQPAEWWEAEFRALRARVAKMEQRVKHLDAVAVDHYERGEVLERLKQDLRILRASLDQLEIDASRVNLPRKHRAY